MDPSRFDTLVRTLTTGGSRRRILGVLSALPLLGTALAAVPEDASAAKGNGRTRGKRKHQDPEQERQRPGTEASSCAKRCRKKSSKQARRKCRKRCTPPTPECTTSQDCPSGELCESGVCLPIPDQCGNDTDCDACERCESGICVAQCQPDEVCRNNQCEAVACTTDADCGDCSRCQDGRCRWQCTVTEVCLSGAGGRCCQPRSCPAGKDCGTVDDGCGGQARCGANTCTQPSNPCQEAVCRSNVCTTGPGHDGASCDDGDACTQSDTCQDGVCVAGSPVVCTTPPGPCYQATGACQLDGTCLYEFKPQGAACNDGDDCTKPDACDGAGACIAGAPVVCPPPDQCHEQGVCNPATGLCSDPTKKADGTACEDGDACTQTDTCQDGLCVGSNPVVCTPLDACHVAGVCDPATGACSNPTAPEGTTCGQRGYRCQSGNCVCPAVGYEVVNGGCFKITNQSCSGCINGGICGCVPVVGSTNDRLCTRFAGDGSCATDVCPMGTACYSGFNECVRPCPECDPSVPNACLS